MMRYINQCFTYLLTLDTFQSADDGWFEDK